MNNGHEVEAEFACHLDLEGHLRIERKWVGLMGQKQIQRAQEESDPKGGHVGRVGVGEKGNEYGYVYDVWYDSYSYSEDEVTCLSAIGRDHDHRNVHFDS